MADQFGSTAVPLAVPAAGVAVSDPALTTVLAYLKAFCNQHGGTAWTAVCPAAYAATPVLTTWAHNPEEGVFNERDIPALFLWRTGGAPEWDASDWRVDRAPWSLLWVFPVDDQEDQARRQPYVNGLAKLVEVAIERGRDPSWASAGDADVSAATYAADTDALKTSIATAVTAQSYSGAALNGAIGAGAIAPDRSPTVRISGPSSAFVHGSLVTFVGTTTLDLPVTKTATISTATLPATISAGYDFKTVTRIDVAAQGSTGGLLEFGVAARTGLGSVLLRHASLMALKVQSWKVHKLPIEMADGSPTRRYHAVEFALQVEEKHDIDITDTSRYGALAGIDIDYQLEDGSVYESDIL